MFASILIFTLLLPAAFLPLALNTPFSSNDLSEMGICLEVPAPTGPAQAAMSLQDVGTLLNPSSCKDLGCLWEVNAGPQVCQ